MNRTRFGHKKSTEDENAHETEEAQTEIDYAKRTLNFAVFDAGQITRINPVHLLKNMRPPPNKETSVAFF